MQWSLFVLYPMTNLCATICYAIAWYYAALDGNSASGGAKQSPSNSMTDHQEYREVLVAKKLTLWAERRRSDKFLTQSTASDTWELPPAQNALSAAHNLYADSVCPAKQLLIT